MGDLYIEGYADRLSCRAGDQLGFHISTSASRYAVEIARLGVEREVVWRREGLEGAEHPVPGNASSHGCGWPQAFALEVPSSWRSGYYVATLRAEDQGGAFTRRNRRHAEGELSFVVRSANPGRDTKILLQLSTNTYNAYNNWGGHSLYSYHDRDGIQGHRVSFERPPLVRFYDLWEAPFVQWAEGQGFALDFAANSDLEFHPGLLGHYQLVLSVGHDEYWSAPMRDQLEAYIGGGGNAAFFSGNSVCWQVRSEEGGKALTCWKQMYSFDPAFAAGDHGVLSTAWSHHLVGRPENQLTGVGFLWGGYHRSHGQFMDGSGAFAIHRPEHWVLAGTGLKAGEEFGGGDSIVGYECDGCELRWEGNLPFATHRDGTPAGFEVLCTAPAQWHPDDCEWYDRWEKGRQGRAVMGVYTRGGTVFTTGTTDWSHGLRGGDPVVARITRNVLERLSA